MDVLGTLHTPATMFSRFNPRLVGWLRRFVSPDAAQDIAQTTWRVAVEKGITDEVEKRFAAYLRAVAYNEVKWLYEHRRRWREVESTLSVFGTSTPQAGCRICGVPIKTYADSRAHGFCNMHYIRFRRGSDLHKPKQKKRGVEVFAQVRKLLTSGFTQRAIAKELGMSEAQVSRIKHGIRNGRMQEAK